MDGLMSSYSILTFIIFTLFYVFQSKFNVFYSLIFISFLIALYYIIFDTLDFVYSYLYVVYKPFIYLHQFYITFKLIIFFLLQYRPR